MKQPAIYIVTNKKDGTLYTGVTSNLPARIHEHKNKTHKGFAAKYNCTNLVYFEAHDTMTDAITREKQIKAGSRKAKIKLIEHKNPSWADLSDQILS